MSRTTADNAATVSGTHRNSRTPLVQIDAEVFEALSVTRDGESGERPDVDGWLGCWAGSDR